MSTMSAEARNEIMCAHENRQWLVKNWPQLAGCLVWNAQNSETSTTTLPDFWVTPHPPPHCCLQLLQPSEMPPVVISISVFTLVSSHILFRAFWNKFQLASAFCNVVYKAVDSVAFIWFVSQCLIPESTVFSSTFMALILLLSAWKMSRRREAWVLSHQEFKTVFCHSGSWVIKMKEVNVSRLSN